MAEIGKEVTRKLKLIPAKVVVLENWYYTYACRDCEKNGISTPIIKATKEPAIIPESFATAEAAAHIYDAEVFNGLILSIQVDTFTARETKPNPNPSSLHSIFAS